MAVEKPEVGKKDERKEKAAAAAATAEKAAATEKVAAAEKAAAAATEKVAVAAAEKVATEKAAAEKAAAEKDVIIKNNKETEIYIKAEDNDLAREVQFVTNKNLEAFRLIQNHIKDQTKLPVEHLATIGFPGILDEPDWLKTTPTNKWFGLTYKSQTFDDFVESKTKLRKIVNKYKLGPESLWKIKKFYDIYKKAYALLPEIFLGVEDTSFEDTLRGEWYDGLISVYNEKYQAEPKNFLPYFDKYVQYPSLYNLYSNKKLP